MDTLNITIVGNGGCLNNGLPYNAFLINDNFLVEAPPDIMVSLNTLNIDVQPIDTLFISHLHGDHTFGLPFLIINKWFKSLKEHSQSTLNIFGPQGIEQHVKAITDRAFTTSHPCYEWLEKHISFTTVTNNTRRTWNTLLLSCVELDHLVETYGFCLARNHETIFVYIADTRWCQQVENVLAKKPKIVLMDMNGGPSNAHVSLHEVYEKGLLLTGNNTIYYGTHLADEFDSPDEHIQCAKQGERISIAL